MLTVKIINRQKKVRISKTDAARAAAQTLRCEKKRNALLSIVFVDNRAIKVYNKRYFGKDGATDVISFPFCEKESGVPYLGDVLVSAEQAGKVAVDYGQSVRDEIALYVVHGVLHLLGYDDVGRRTGARMAKRQEEIFRKFLKSRVRGQKQQAQGSSSKGPGENKKPVKRC